MAHQLSDFRRTIVLVGQVTRAKDNAAEKKHSFTVSGLGWEHFIGCGPGQVPEVGSVVEVECEWSEFDGKTKPGRIISIERFDGPAAATNGSGKGGDFLRGKAAA